MKMINFSVIVLRTYKKGRVILLERNFWWVSLSLSR